MSKIKKQRPPVAEVEAQPPKSTAPSPAEQQDHGMGPFIEDLSLNNPERAFLSLIHPISADDFFDDFFQQKPLVVSRSDPTYYAGLFSKEILFSLLAQNEQQSEEYNSMLAQWNESKFRLQAYKQEMMELHHVALELSEQLEKEGSELDSIQKEIAVLTRTIKSKKSDKSAIDSAKKQVNVLLKHKKQIEANLEVLNELKDKLSARHDEINELQQITKEQIAEGAAFYSEVSPEQPLFYGDNVNVCVFNGSQKVNMNPHEQPASYLSNLDIPIDVRAKLSLLRASRRNNMPIDDEDLRLAGDEAIAQGEQEDDYIIEQDDEHDDDDEDEEEEEGNNDTDQDERLSKSTNVKQYKLPKPNVYGYSDLTHKPVDASIFQGKTLQQAQDMVNELMAQQVTTKKTVRHDELLDLFRSGCTIQALHPQQYYIPVWRCLYLLECFFGSLIGSNCYLTPKGSQGLAPHHDDVDVFVCQLQGSKRWKIYEPVHPLSNECSGDLSYEQIGEPMLQVTLEQGDFMYLPRGYVHEAMACDEDDSVHLTISALQAQTWGELLKTALGNIIQEKISHDVDFRLALPLNYTSYLGTIHDKSIPHGDDSHDIDEDDLQPLEDVPQVILHDKAGHFNRTWLRVGNINPEARIALRQYKQIQADATAHELLQKIAASLSVNTAADELARDFYLHRLPPPPPTDQMELDEDVDSEDSYDLDEDMAMDDSDSQNDTRGEDSEEESGSQAIDDGVEADDSDLILTKSGKVAVAQSTVLRNPLGAISYTTLADQFGEDRVGQAIDALFSNLTPSSGVVFNSPESMGFCVEPSDASIEQPEFEGDEDEDEDEDEDDEDEDEDVQYSSHTPAILAKHFHYQESIPPHDSCVAVYVADRNDNSTHMSSASAAPSTHDTPDRPNLDFDDIDSDSGSDADTDDNEEDETIRSDDEDHSDLSDDDAEQTQGNEVDLDEDEDEDDGDDEDDDSHDHDEQDNCRFELPIATLPALRMLLEEYPRILPIDAIDLDWTLASQFQCRFGVDMPSSLLDDLTQLSDDCDEDDDDDEDEDGNDDGTMTFNEADKMFYRYWLVRELFQMGLLAIVPENFDTLNEIIADDEILFAGEDQLVGEDDDDDDDDDGSLRDASTSLISLDDMEGDYDEDDDELDLYNMGEGEDDLDLSDLIDYDFNEDDDTFSDILMQLASQEMSDNDEDDEDDDMFTNLVSLLTSANKRKPAAKSGVQIEVLDDEEGVSSDNTPPQLMAPAEQPEDVPPRKRGRKHLKAADNESSESHQSTQRSIKKAKKATDVQPHDNLPTSKKTTPQKSTHAQQSRPSEAQQTTNANAVSKKRKSKGQRKNSN